MLGGVKLTVSLSRENNCFAYINSSYCTNAQECQCIQVQTGEGHLHLWAVFSSGVPEGCILLNPLYCRLLGLSLGMEVYVSTSPNIRTIDTLYIEADGNEDQVILEHNQIPLQSVFLNQVRLVVAKQKSVVWISPSMPIVFTPDQTGILVNQSSVFVRIKVLDTYTPQITPSEEKQSDLIVNKGLLRPFINLSRKIALRALPIEGDGKKDLIHPYTVFMHEDLVDENINKSTLIVALMKSLTNKSNEQEGVSTWNRDLCVEVVPVDSVIFRSLCKEVYSDSIPTILIPKSLNKIINIDNGTMIMLTFLNSDQLRQPSHIEIITYTNHNNQESESVLVERFKTTVIQNTYSGKVFLINHDMVKQNRELTPGYIKFRLTPIGLTYTTLTQETFRNCTVSAKCLNESELVLHKPTASLDYDYKSYCRTIKPIEQLIQKVISHIYFDIHRDAKFKRCSDLKSSILVTGQSGTGKSTLCHLIEKEISLYSHNVHCRPLKGRKDVATVLSKIIQLCTERKPSLLILDDVDALLPANMEGLSPLDISTYNGLASEIKNVLMSTCGVSILMTARGVNDLHPTFKLITGRPLFTAHFHMPELGQEDRVQLFQHLLNYKIRDSFEAGTEDVARLAMDTAGHTVREIVDYYSRRVFTAIKKRNANPNGPKPRLIEDVTKDVEKAKAFDIWGPLGGMEDVKAKLDECIFWPIMYPALFPSQSCGILLYGPPGTGKSLIGTCLARMTTMHMITVKGPELLSKYIGQSEAAVREVFDKADMKRPCILFFDEFDSLAPKRGHDSTGVTDRVVNQLLARLDGAEGGARGPVIAATSRPDLVDPALLRTGRLQTHVYCPLPDAEGRYAVLRTLSKDFHLCPDVDLRAVARETAGFSPADLKSLLVTAQLARLDAELININQSSERDSATLESVVINADDITSSLQETKPSLSNEQKAFYDIIYRRFRGEGPSVGLSGASTTVPAQTTMQRQRVTLA